MAAGLIALGTGCGPGSEQSAEVLGAAAGPAAMPQSVSSEAGAKARQRAADILRAQQNAPKHFWLRNTVGDEGQSLSFVAENSAISARLGFAGDRVTITPQPGGAAASWHWSIAVSSFGRTGSLRPVQTAAVEASANRADYRRPSDGLSEWYYNGPLGLEQGFTLARSPDGDASKPVVIELAIDTDLQPVAKGNSAVLFQDDSQRTVLAYRELFVADADGKQLPALLQLSGAKLRIVVDDQHARYPLVVDPLVGVLEQKLEDPNPAYQDSQHGRRVALDGNTAILAPWIGQPVVFVRNGVTWTEQTTFPRIADGVALHGDTAAIARNGNVWVYVRSGGVWTEQDAIVSTWGWNQPMALQGDTLVVGAANGSLGPTNVFVRSGGVWTVQGALDSSYGAEGAGQAVAIDKDTVLVGAPSRWPAISTAGKVSVWVRNAGVWTKQQTLKAPKSYIADGFGHSVSLAGDTALVGAVWDNTAHIFSRSGAVWTHQQQIKGNDTGSGDRFGESASLDGKAAIIGASRHDGHTGSAYLFEKKNGIWTQSDKLTAPKKAAKDFFGHGVALHGGYAVVGAPGTPGPGGSDAGVGYVMAVALSNGSVCDNGGQCQSGFCVDGVCCDSACGGSVTGDCQACSVAAGSSAQGVCSLLSAATLCRPAGTSCDEAELCDGNSAACPPDAPASAGTVCRPALGGCDAIEFCDGKSMGCPADEVKPANTECRPSAGVCDLAESCDGASVHCPGDVMLPAGFVCRPSAGDCDVAESCVGNATSCPDDGFAADGSKCSDDDECTAPDSCLAGQCQPGANTCGEGGAGGEGGSSSSTSSTGSNSSSGSGGSGNGSGSGGGGAATSSSGHGAATNTSSGSVVGGAKGVDGSCSYGGVPAQGRKLAGWWLVAAAAIARRRRRRHH